MASTTLGNKVSTRGLSHHWHPRLITSLAHIIGTEAYHNTRHPRLITTLGTHHWHRGLSHHWHRGLSHHWHQGINHNRYNTIHVFLFFSSLYCICLRERAKYVSSYYHQICLDYYVNVLVLYDIYSPIQQAALAQHNSDTYNP